MTALESIRAALVADATVLAALAQRINPKQADQNQPFPYAVLDTVHTQLFNNLSGSGSLDRCEVELEVWANSYTDATTIAKACRTALEMAGFLCLGQLTDLYDGSISPGAFAAGWTFQAFQ